MTCDNCTERAICLVYDRLRDFLVVYNVAISMCHDNIWATAIKKDLAERCRYYKES